MCATHILDLLSPGHSNGQRQRVCLGLAGSGTLYMLMSYRHLAGNPPHGFHSASTAERAPEATVSCRARTYTPQPCAWDTGCVAGLGLTCCSKASGCLPQGAVANLPLQAGHHAHQAGGCLAGAHQVRVAARLLSSVLRGSRATPM